MRNTACVVTLGCKANQFESAALEQLLAADGYELCSFDQGAALVVVNTCTVTAATDAQSRKLIRRARRYNSQCRIVVTGCCAQVQPQAFVDLPGVEWVIGNMEKAQLLTVLQGHGRKIQVSEIAQATQCPDLKIASFFEHSRAFVQIQSGCDAFCSYCIIPYARGRSRSVALSSVIEQIHQLVASGYQEIVLTGIHIGNYGRDLTPRSSLARLVQEILDQTSLHRLRLGSVEPQELTPELIECVAASARVCPHFHIPLQSGSDVVLEKMNRHYTTAQFRSYLDAILTLLPKASIGVDLISGFPGEGESQHQETLALVSSLPLHYLHVFPFSKRPGTAAAVMSEQVDSLVAKRRSAELRDIGKAKTQQYYQGFIGGNIEVVVENHAEGQCWKGISAEYIPVFFKAPGTLGGRCLNLEVYAATEMGLEAKRVI